MQCVRWREGVLGPQAEVARLRDVHVALAIVFSALTGTVGLSRGCPQPAPPLCIRNTATWFPGPHVLMQGCL